jgi:hypothetical protein
MMDKNAMHTPAALDAVIHYRGLGLVRGRVRTISMEGMTLELGPIVLHWDTPVEVALVPPRGEGRTLPHLRGLVVGNAGDTIELRFCDIPLTTRHSLLQLLRERSVPDAIVPGLEFPREALGAAPMH